MQTWVMIPTAHGITSVEECSSYCIFPNILHRTILFLPLWLRKVRAAEAGFMESDVWCWFSVVTKVYNDPCDENKGRVKTKSKLLSSHHLHLLLLKETYPWVTRHTRVAAVRNPIEKEQRLNEKFEKMISRDFYRRDID